MNHFMQFIFVVLSILIAGLTVTAQQKSANLKTPEMFFGYTTRIGVFYAKDPSCNKVWKPVFDVLFHSCT